MSGRVQTEATPAGRRADHVAIGIANHLDSGHETAFNGTDSLRPSDVQIVSRPNRGPSPSVSSPRTGHRMLDDLKSELSDRDLSVVRSVAEFRYLTAKQIEALHFAGHASRVSAARKTRLTLERLNGHRVLSRLERRVGGVRAGSASFVYGLGPVGLRLLTDEGTRGRWKEPSPNFLAHTLAIADLAIELTISRTLGDSAKRPSIVTEPDCWRSFSSGVFGARETLKPDLSVVTNSGGYEYRWFVEIDLGTESGTAIKKKADIYVSYFKTGVEQEQYEIFPRVLWVTPNPKRAELLKSALSKVGGAPHELFAVCLSVEAKHALEGGNL